jgi:hypothetical protein
MIASGASAGREQQTQLGDLIEIKEYMKTTMGLIASEAA